MVFADICAECHGDIGQGTARAPLLVGDAALRAFDTAESVYEFAATFMPADAPGTLRSEQYMAVVAFLLSENGIPLAEPLTVPGADLVQLHR